MKIAIMQPAFIPPASYFRLFAATDLFVILDDVQFNRRWYTHRQKLTNLSGEKEWLTLPIKKTSRDNTMIKDLEWAEDATEKWRKQVRKFPALDNGGKSYLSAGMFCAVQFEYPVLAIDTFLRLACEKLVIPHLKYYSSEISFDKSLRGKDRIIAICKKLGATEYVNSPGGHELYDEAEFSEEGIKLTFLPEWKGSYDSVVERLNNESPQDIHKEIYANI